jgi:hypothetical protein
VESASRLHFYLVVARRVVRRFRAAGVVVPDIITVAWAAVCRAPGRLHIKTGVNRAVARFVTRASALKAQTLAAQESALHEAGAAKVFKEKISGAANHRAQLHRLLKTIDAGDLVIVTRLDRPARSTRDLLNILDKIAKQARHSNHSVTLRPTRPQPTAA